MYDVIIVGGGPAGLSAALTLGRARRRVLLCDAGPRRNARAHAIHNFVTRDGTPPAEFRRVGREQLAAYTTVEVADAGVDEVRGEADDFTVRLGDRSAHARRVLLCTGMIDEMPALPGYAELWGAAIFQCPYCHGFEAQDRAWGLIAAAPMFAEGAPMLLNWTADLVVFTDGKFPIPDDLQARFAAANIRLEQRPITRLVHDDGRLLAVELAGGDRVQRDVLFARPAQRQVPLVAGLGLDLDPAGFVRVEFGGQTSRPGILAAGDLTTMMQGAMLAAAAGTQAGAMLGHTLHPAHAGPH